MESEKLAMVAKTALDLQAAVVKLSGSVSLGECLGPASQILSMDKVEMMSSEITARLFNEMRGAGFSGIEPTVGQKIADVIEKVRNDPNLSPAAQTLLLDAVKELLGQPPTDSLPPVGPPASDVPIPTATQP